MKSDSVIRKQKRKRLLAGLLTAVVTLSMLQGTSAEAAQATWEFGYTGDIQTWTCPMTGEYRLEVWGASGGKTCLQSPNINGETVLGANGGEGGYSYGTIYLQAGTVLYIGVGEEGRTGYRGIWGDENGNGDWIKTHIEDGSSFNGGGSSGQYGNGVHYMMGGGGGGATHIAWNVNDGELRNYEDNQNDVLLVAGGGGGGAFHSGGTNAGGGTGGGISGGTSRHAEGGQPDRGGHSTNHKDISRVLDENGNPRTEDGHTWQRWGSEVDRIDSCLNYHSWRIWRQEGDDGGWDHAGSSGCVATNNTYVYGPGYERLLHTCGGFGRGGDSYNNNGSGGGGWYGGAGAVDGSADGGGGGSSHLNAALYDGDMLQGGNRGHGRARLTQIYMPVPAGGGSSYLPVNLQGNSCNRVSSGVQPGNGCISVTGIMLGTYTESALHGVKAADTAAPGQIQECSVVRQPLSGNRVKVTWEVPNDYGTTYYHRVESYRMDSGEKLLDSNITGDTLISGIQGYRYLVDGNSMTAVNNGNGSFTGSANVTLSLPNGNRFLHVAAVDKAGNIGGTTHIPLGADNILWPIYTQQLQIEAGENVYHLEDKTYYVRSDGTTPFTLSYDSYMDGIASREYQITRSVFASRSAAGEARNIVGTEKHSVSSGVIECRANQLRYMTEGTSLLGQYPHIITRRSNYNKNLYTEAKFTLDRAAHGRQIDLFPRAGAETTEEVQYSDCNRDIQNGIVVIGDGEGPEIGGTQVLEALGMIDRQTMHVEVNLSVTDALSGVREAYLRIENTDNAGEAVYEMDGNGTINVLLSSEEPVFNGDFRITVCAVDNVGNVTQLHYDTTEFALQTDLRRILEPHDPIFQCGESGILTIKAYGYVDRIRVEFPDALERERAYSTEYIYPDPPYVAEEQIQFMIPLYTEERVDYVVTITAYKDGEELVANEPIMVVTGTVLDDFRTRLR